MVFMPIVSTGNNREDLLSRLLKDRIILLSGNFTQDLSTSICAQLLYLDAEDCNKDIHIYINSPGGNITDCLAIIDTMNCLQSDVSTIAVGLSASAGAMTLLSGAEGKRFSLPHSEIMFHEPLGGLEGTASDVKRRYERFMNMRVVLKQMCIDILKKPAEEIEKRLFERDNFFNAEQALDFGIINKIITKADKL
ncbi:MAG: ATP-dependent Clp protease proteolytic subunit [Alphaproteobacteria bacterium]|nr:ATP-dependent Clp protease proteolytic subunit [Alphaproteobacteria bacterium]MBL0717831.1 ATP-dependent Clp protease proteolytic subunit [Alphaproteobacteria bacterium]